MERWGSWLLALAVATGTTTAQAQGPFIPPMPTPKNGGFMPPMPSPVGGEPSPIGPSSLGGGGLSPTGAIGPGTAPPSSMLTLGNNPNAFDDDIIASAVEWSAYSSFTVDFLTLWTEFSSNPAYRSNQQAPGTGRFQTEGFRYPDPDLVPRLGMDVRIGPYWGVRGSWMQMEQTAQNAVAFNANPNARIITPPVLQGSYVVTESDQIQLNNVFIRNIQTTFRESKPLQIISPNPYWFVDVVPRVSLLPPQTNLPPFTLANAVQAGFPDSFLSRHSFNTQVADLDVTHRIEFNRATGVFGLGVRYGYISQQYVARRTNAGGSNTIPGYDPFITLMIDAVINTNQDSETLSYAHNFGGVGPKLSFELGTEVSPFARLYSKFNGSFLLGSRKEIAFYEALQSVVISDISRVPPADLFYTRTVPLQQAAQRDIFTCIPVGEVEAGIEVAMGGRFFPIFKLGFFGQWWLGGGNATNPNATLCIYGVNASLGIGF